MFESWPVHFQPEPRREVEPPVAVIVDLAVGFARSPIARRADGLPMRVRAEGMQLDAKVPGALHAWARTVRGDWLGRVRLRIPAGRGYVETDQWIPAAAITPVAGSSANDRRCRPS